jgi:hypothetical protein
MATRRLELIIAGDAKGLNRVLGEVDGFGKKLSGKLRSIGRAGALAFGGAAVGVGAGLVDAFGEAREAEKIGRVTAQLVKTTGGAANVTAGQVAGLSEKLAAQIGVDDELIQANANVLLSFKQVANQAGAGNNIFDRTVALSQDMAQVLGTDSKAATLQLGKALANPVKGLTALTRAGVVFTKQQREQIEQLVESGDLLGAQKIILGEVEGEFGGAAKAAADPMAKLGIVVDNLKEKVGLALLPVVEKAATWLGENLPIMIERAKPIVRGIGEVFGWLGDRIRTIVEWVRANWPQIQATISRVLEQVRAKVQAVVAVVQALWARFGERILNQARAVWEFIVRIVTAAVEAVRGVIKIVTALIRGDWGAVWNGIKQLVSGIWDGIKAIIAGAIATIKNTLAIVLEAIKGLWSAAWGWVSREVSEAWDGIKRTVWTAIGTVVRWVGDIAHRFTSVLGDIAGILVAPFREAFNAIARLWNSTVGKLHFEIPGWIPFLGGKSFDVPDIPTLHQGGEFRAPVPGGEGLALLRDRERVLPPGVFGTFAGTSTSVVIEMHVTAPPGADRGWLHWLADEVHRDSRDGGPLSNAIRKAVS